MPYTLRYGTDSELQLSPPATTRVVDCRAPHGVPLDDPTAAVMEALAHPLDYPPLASSTVPGDRVVLAVEPGVAQVEQVVAGVIFSLLESGTAPKDISLVVGSNRRPPLTLLPTAVRHDVRVMLHNPADEQSLQYLAADHAARPIYFHRALCDADLLLPITTARLGASLGYVGAYSGLFPTFADLATQDRFHAPGTTDHAARQQRRREEADEAAWLLGVHFALQIVPAGGDRILHVVAGQSNAVQAEVEKLCAASWQFSLSQKVSLAVVAVDGDDDQQTWENLARALDATLPAVAEGGAIALVTDLQVRPGPALARLASGTEGRELAHELRHEHSPDAHAAALLSTARERFDLYLLSSLAAPLIEDLRLTHVGNPAELARLVAGHRSVLLLGNGQFARVEIT